jgi:hypothetical protein
MQRWTGTIAYLDTPAGDGRTLRAPQELRTGGLPLPLAVLRPGESTPEGTVDSVTVVGNELRAEGSVSDGLLKPGENMPVGVDLDDVEFGPDDDTSVLVGWRLRAVTAYRGQGEPAWPGTHIRLADDALVEDRAARALDSGLDDMFRRLGPPDA